MYVHTYKYTLNSKIDTFFDLYIGKQLFKFIFYKTLFGLFLYCVA